MKFGIFILLCSLTVSYSNAAKSLNQRFEACLELHNKILNDAQNLTSNLYSIQKRIDPSEETPYEMLAKDVSKVKKGIQKLNRKTEKMLDHYEYYVDELEFEVEDVFESLNRGSTFLAKGTKKIDDAAFENYHENLKLAHDHYLSLLEHLGLYQERMVKLKGILHKMINKHQFTF
ncbi:MAG: hypothetical protein R2780_06200 [Crocinitomicaceae bacterium]|nr:hypothetical protein [Crocinitomicaceae bacterium]